MMGAARLLPCVILAAACGPRAQPAPIRLAVPEPSSDSVESVIFLIGDAGQGTLQTSPVLQRLRAEVERWSQALPDSSVIVLYLGDNVYPAGVRAADHPDFAEDSTHLQAQLDVMAGAQARAQGARAFFLPGNHDWGHRPGAPGRARLSNMERLIERRARAGAFHAALKPGAGDPGPSVVLIGQHLKLLLIDTAWWLLEADYNEKLAFLQKLERELGGLGNRELLIAAHHPWQSGSAHGGLVPFWRTIGVRWLLARSGALLQDLNSLPYRDLKNQLGASFRRHGTPLLFAGGHDHNLQIISATVPHEPRYIVVSGAGSKSSKVAPTSGTVFHRAEPGYMRVVVMRGGAIHLFVESVSEVFLDCKAGDDARQALCMADGASRFRTVFSLRLK